MKAFASIPAMPSAPAPRRRLAGITMPAPGNAPMPSESNIDGVDALEYFQKNFANDSADGAQYPSLYKDEFGRVQQSDVRQLQKILAGANGGWRRLFKFAATSPDAPRSGLIFNSKNAIFLDAAGVYRHVPALQAVAEYMHARLDALIGHAWDSRPQRIEAAYHALKNIISYAPNWGDVEMDGNISLSYIQFACGLSYTVISDTSMRRPILDRLTSAMARCAALEVLKEYLLNKIGGYKTWLHAARAEGAAPEILLPIENKAKNAAATAMLLDRALDVARMRVHVFKGMELAQSLANLKQSIFAHIAQGDMLPALRERALHSVQMIDNIIAQAASAWVPCSLNCTTNIVHERAGYLEEIAFGGDGLRRCLAEDAMRYGYEALAIQLDAKRYRPSRQHSALPPPPALPATLPTDLMELR